MGVGFPETVKLDQFGYFILQAFGHTPFQVGSSVVNKRGWHDVDIVLILPDDEYRALGFIMGDNECSMRDTKWLCYSMAFTTLGRDMTGLPIDFKFQSQSYANKHYPAQGDNRHCRNFIGGLEWERQQERYKDK
jgi:hypothetical protein